GHTFRTYRSNGLRLRHPNAQLAPALDTGAAPPGAPQTPAGPTGGPATGVHALRPAQREAPADWGPHRPYEDPHQPPPPPRSRNPRP
ncbi:hypothetical protein KQI59_20180, partial [Streptomyces sp. Vc17.3-30]|nr:hypothetical protein [Streptomyces sp. Vc17.3-30]